MILFEQLHSAHNHVKDLFIIAKLLKLVGLKVAVLNVYDDDYSKYDKDIQILKLPFKKAIPVELSSIESIHILKKLFGSVRYICKHEAYMKKVYEFVYDSADSFYLGSYLSYPTMSFMKSSKPCFYWGLRSNCMFPFKQMIHEKFKLHIPYLLKAKSQFLRNPNQYLFVSNEAIQKEFEKCGVSASQLILRPERIVWDKSPDNIEKLSKQFTLLTIGLLRPDKQIHQTIYAFNKANLANSKLLLIGKSESLGYEAQIQNLLTNNKHITRVAGFIPEIDFNNYFLKSHFVIFADKRHHTSITNGTLVEALINMRPVIVPDFPPFSSYIDKYGVGLKYKVNDVESFAMAIRKAKELGVNYFMPAIKKYLSTIECESIRKNFGDKIIRLLQK